MKFLPTIVFFLSAGITFMQCRSKSDASTPPSIVENSDPATITPSFVSVDTFEVTVGDFEKFLDATDHLTTADSFQWSGIWNLASGAWDVGENANWKKHDGINVADNNLPVVHVSYKDACAYCAWAGGRLPTADEWDILAGDTIIPGNVWQGLFPHVDEGLDGYKTITAPVGSFPPSTTGLYDVYGNVWEWTSTWDPAKNERILKGGSFLCDLNVCQGYIPSRYQTTTDDSGLSHLGIRCVYDGSR